jgi:predicted lipoprotein with Yx(FWY)xxD motif
MILRALSASLLAVAAASATGPAAPAPPPPTVMVADTETLGRVLTDPDGHTLYRYDLDTSTTVACVDPCTITRKPLLTPPGSTLQLPYGIAGTLGTITRPDGGDQVTYDGSPLYWFTGDRAPADTSGVDLEWHVISPRAGGAG